VADPIVISEAAGMEKPTARIFRMRLRILWWQSSEAYFGVITVFLTMEARGASGMTGAYDDVQ